MWLLNPYRFGTALDANAAAYIAAVEAADGQALEAGVRTAINAFVVGCKADGIWNAIKASCILAGARTLNGALVPLVGTAPTNFNFVAGDYNRKTGLVGNGSTKYLNSNRATNADPQNDFHQVVYVTVPQATTVFYAFIGHDAAASGASHLTYNAIRCRSSISLALPSTNSGFIGASRNSSASYTYRHGGLVGTDVNASQLPSSLNHFVFARNVSNALNSPTSARLAFYSIGESLNLALLDARVTALINAFAAAIP